MQLQSDSSGPYLLQKTSQVKTELSINETVLFWKKSQLPVWDNLKCPPGPQIAIMAQTVV